MARPKKFDFATKEAIEKAEIFGRFRATYETMAEFFGCCERTIHREMQDENSIFCQSYKKAFADCKMSIAETQFNLALGGNVPLLIWLGKQYLGQKDKVETEDKKQDQNINITYEVVPSGTKAENN